MIRCGLCGKNTAPSEKVVAVVLSTRSAIYPSRPKAHRIARRRNISKAGGGRFKDDPGGVGTEIVKEVLAHERCAIKRKAEEVEDCA